MTIEKLLKVAVITGGHSFDVPNFHRLFRELPGVDAYIQHMDDFASATPEVRNSYDVLLFFIMLSGAPVDAGVPWHQGKPLSALERIGETAQGIVILHHAILAYPQWPVWVDMTGIKYDPSAFEYAHDQTMNIHVVNADHPITQGLRDWRMIDETYLMLDAAPDSEILLTTDHPRCMKTIGWTRQYKNARVFNFQSGHDNQTWIDANFRQVLLRGIRWSARWPADKI